MQRYSIPDRPLDDVDEQNGCIHFSRGQSLNRLLPYCVASGDPLDNGRLLATTDEVTVSNEMACPLSASGATVHAYTTLHMTRGNFTVDRQRRAYIFNLCNAEAAE